MSLSNAQMQLLEKNIIPADLQKTCAEALSNNGTPKNSQSPDFLMLLTEQLQKTENHLQKLRLRLAEAEIGQLPKNLEGDSITLDSLEDTVKQQWLTATALWRTIDTVVISPSEYEVTLRPQHVQYALNQKNLAVVEMIRFVKPDFFKLKSPSFFSSYLALLMGVIGGCVLGLIGGCFGGAKQGYEKKKGFFRFFLSIVYAIAGIVKGFAMGIVKGARIGFQTGNMITALQLGFWCAFLDPFHADPGTKYQQAGELKIQETLFELSHQRQK